MIEKYDEETQQISSLKQSKKDLLLTVLSEGNFLRKCKNYTKRALFKLISPICNFFIAIDEGIGKLVRYSMLKDKPIVENRIVFGTFQSGYTCNCKYIAEKILEKNLDYELIFLVNTDVYNNKDQYDIPKGVKLVKRGSIDSFVALTTAKYWFDNALNCIWKDIPKKEGQIYINTWHGSLGIKRLSGDRHWIKLARKSNDLIDYFLTNSTFDEYVFTESFWPDVEQLKFGHPRNDIFFDVDKMDTLKKKVYDFYKIDPSVKTVLYAPTFRDNKSDVSAIKIDCKKLKDALEQKFGGEWVVLVRAHMHNQKNPVLKNMFASRDYVINVSSYYDIQELMAAVDVGITDYSSWIFDFIFTRRPAFIYATDISKYINSRGFYYSLDNTPFSIADGNHALVQNIMDFDNDDYSRKLDEFFEKQGCYEDGHACERVVDFILEQSEMSAEN